MAAPHAPAQAALTAIAAPRPAARVADLQWLRHKLLRGLHWQPGLHQGLLRGLHELQRLHHELLHWLHELDSPARAAHAKQKQNQHTIHCH
jgi:hypothetical protein